MGSVNPIIGKSERWKCNVIFKFTTFINKLYAAVQAGKVSRWVAASFQQYLKARDSEKTIASIDTTTVGIFSAFIQRSLLTSFIGKSTIPTKLSGRQILIFKLDDPRRDVVGPLLAAALHMTIVSNLCMPRFDPIGIFIDELPSLYLKALRQWINGYAAIAIQIYLNFAETR
jgi:type IV secretory pathway TraG/TraD family ATPase VirD4